MATTEKKIKVGLALGGGSAKGFAHIGVLKVLKRAGIPIDMISGTSIGSLIGALYLSSGGDLGFLERKSKEFKLIEHLDFSLKKGAGLIKGKKIEYYLNEVFENRNIEDLEIPLYITSVDLEKNEEVIFYKGNLSKAVRASIAIPGVFEPSIINNRVLFDGGIKDSVPSKVLKDKGADIVIGVDLANIPKSKVVLEKIKRNNNLISKPKLKQTILEFMELISKEMINRESIDIMICPKLKKEDILAFNDADRLIKLGEEAAEEKIVDIRNKFFNEIY